MLYRIIGGVLVLLVVGALYVITEGEQSVTPQTEQPVFQSSPSDNDFKNLKIN